MNYFYKSFASRIAVAILIISVTLAGCSKQSEIGKIDKPVASGDGTKLTVKILGIEDDALVSSAKVSSIGSSRSTNKQVAVVPKIVKFDAFDATVSVEQDAYTSSKVAIGNSAKGSNGSALMAAAVEIGFKFRLLLYKKDGTFASSTQLTSGTDGEVEVEKGVEYNWYAVSYNSTDSVPSVDPANPVLKLPGNRDVLHAQGEIAIPKGTTGEEVNIPLGILFKHKLARVAVELNTMGLFGGMYRTNISVTGVTVKNATLDFRTGALSNLVDYKPVINNNSFVFSKPVTGVGPESVGKVAPGSPLTNNDEKVAYIYSADETPITGLTVTLTDLVIYVTSTTLEANLTSVVGARNYGTVLNGANGTAAVFTFNVTPAMLHSKKALINLVELPITRNGVKWGRRNLYVREGGHNPYRFLSNVAFNAAGGYSLETYRRMLSFPFKSKSPFFYGVSGANEDPCKLVYPENTWRQANQADLSTLTTYTAETRPTIGRSTYNRYVYAGATGHFGTGTPFPNEVAGLYVYAWGYASSSSTTEDIGALDFGTTLDTFAHNWTSDSNPDGSAIYYEITGATNAVVEAHLKSAPITTINGKIKSDFKGIRCVRVI